MMAEQRYPELASEAFAQRNRARRNLILATFSISTFAVGGWMACAAWAARSVAIAEAAAASAAATSASTAAFVAGAEAATATATATAAAASAESAVAAAASISATASSIGNVASGVSTCVTAAVDGGLASPVVGGAAGWSAKWISWAALGGRSAAHAAAVAKAAAATATATAATAQVSALTAGGAAAAASVTAATAAAGVTGATTTAAASTALAVAGGIAVMRTAFIGGQVITTAGGLGCMGAKCALEQITEPTCQDVQASEYRDGKMYNDFLMWPGADDRVLYVGQFKGRLPHGSGRLFWKDTQYESFVGIFAEGSIQEGIFINQNQVVVGRLKEQEGTEGGGARRLAVSGFQPEAMYDPNEPCVICLERPTILMEGRVMVPCHHGCVCSECFKNLRECPMCRELVNGHARIF